MSGKKIIQQIQSIVMILLILFGIFIIYQVILKILGGSWEIEDIILALLIFNIGFSFTIALNQVKTNSDLNSLNYQFKHLANDFKLRLQDS